MSGINLQEHQTNIIYQEAIRYHETNTEYALIALLHVRVYRDGDKWCALYGENIQEGVCGFGVTPHAACQDFMRAWYHPPVVVNQ